MPDALVCAFSDDEGSSLAASLEKFGYAVERVTTHADTLYQLKSKSFDALVAQASPDGFADFLRSAIRLRPALDVHLFKDRRIFCFYPMNSQSEKLICAICAAPFEFPRSLLRYARPVKEEHTLTAGGNK